MERGSLDEQQAFHLLCEHARRTNRKVVNVAGSILESHRLLSNALSPSCSTTSSSCEQRTAAEA